MIPLFVNQASADATRFADDLRPAGRFVVVQVAPDRVTQAVANAVASGTTRVAVAGGDGTVSAAAAALARTEAELVVIPTGTLNHFARDHGIPEDPARASAAASSPRVIRVDLGSVNGRIFLNTSSVGVYAHFVRVRERLEPRIGYWASSIAAMVRTFARVRAFPLRLESESVQKAYESPLVFIGVGERELKLPRLGGRIAYGRRGLHVVVVRGRRRARLVAMAFAAAARGIRAISRTPHLDSFVVTRCTIEQHHETVAIDGEIVTLASPLQYELLPGALRLVVP